MTLEPDETRRLIFNLPEGAPGVKARIGGDALQIDNEAHLLPDRQKPVRVQAEIKDDALRKRVRSALESTEAVQFTNLRPELLITDAPLSGSASMETWRVHFDAPAEASPYVGPFVVDQTHPLTAGASLDGVVWAAGKEESYAGLPVATAGNAPLIVDSERADGGRDLKWSLRLDMSNLQDAPAWPILIWNLVQWRASETPGLRRYNYRLGDEVSVKVNPFRSEDVESASVFSPSGKERELPPPDEGVFALAEETGVYRIAVGAETYRFAVNAFSKNESNLQDNEKGEWGAWTGAELLERGYRDMGWVLLLIAVLVLAAHLKLAGVEQRPAPSAGVPA